MVAPVPVPIDQRFAQLIKQFGLTKNSFAMSLGKTASVVQHLIDGRNKPGYDLLCKVFEIYPNVSRDWLLLGRGPMLVSGEPASKPVMPVAATTPELPLEPLELSEIEVPPHRRPAPSIAGSRLQPAEIAATLALAAAANQPVRTSAPTPAELPVEQVASTEIPASMEAPAPVMPKETTTPVLQAATVTPPKIYPAAPAASVPVLEQPAPMPAPGFAAPEQYMAGALHAQHLQHQLAMAEMRNQHLLEQQQMLREMLTMARQALV